MSIILVMSLAGSVGALSRYLISGLVQERTGADFPIGTMAVNLIGAFLLGLLAGAGNDLSLLTTGLIGFLGGFTTFSTWMVETLRLGPTRLRSRGLANLGISLFAGIALALVGFSLTN
jgi:CrcB protein